MKRVNIAECAILAILAIVCSIVAFSVPFERTVAFGVAYLAELVAIILQICFFKTAFSNQDKKARYSGYQFSSLGAVILAFKQYYLLC